MKKIFALFLSMALCLSLCACGSSKVTEAAMGEAVSSGVVEVTVSGFQFAEEGVHMPEEGEDFCVPAPFPYAMTGNDMMDNLTLSLSEEYYIRATEEKAVVWLEFTIKNTSDIAVSLTGSPMLRSGDAAYDMMALTPIQLGATMAAMMPTDFDGIFYAKQGEEWKTGGGILILSAQSETLCRAAVKVPVEMKDSDTPITVTFSLPDKDDNVETYTVSLR